MPTDPPGASRRVLVVDDETSIRDLVATALRFEGFDVSTAGTGSEALKGVESARPELVILDVMLPVMRPTTRCSASPSEATTT